MQVLSKKARVRQSALARLLAEPRQGGIKQAEAGGSQEAGFEQAFASLAHTYLADKAPKLLAYELGFQLIDKNDDGTRAAGAFGFKIGNRWALAPVFFLGGELKGHELLYLKDQDLFVPLKEPWVNYLLGKDDSAKLGEGVHRNTSLMGLTGSNLAQLVRSPYKYASEWRKTAALVMAQSLSRSPAEALEGRGDLVDFMKSAGEIAVKPILALCQAVPAAVSAMDKHYGPQGLERLVSLAIGGEKKALYEGHPKVKLDGPAIYGREATESYTYRGKKKPREKEPAQEERPRNVLDIMAEGRGKQAAAQAKPTVKLKVYRPGGPAVRDLNAEEKEKLLRARYLIKDDRDDNEVATAFNVSTPLSLINPDRTGLYEVLIKPDSWKKCLVVLAPQSSFRRENFCTVVDLENKRWLNTHVSRIWTIASTTLESFEKWWEGLPEVKDEPPDDMAMLLTRGGQGTVPFTVDEKDGDTWHVWWRDHADLRRPYRLNDLDRWAFNRRREIWGPMPTHDCRCTRIRLTKRPGSKLGIHAGGELWAPPETKILSLATEKKEGDDTGGSHPPPLEPGELDEVQVLLRTQTEKVKVSEKQGAYLIEWADKKPVRLAREEAICHLVQETGIREKVACALLDQVTTAVAATALIKKARPDDFVQGAPDAPGFPDPSYGSEPVIGGTVPSIERQTWRMPVQGLIATKGSPSDYDPTILPDHSALRSVATAVQSGDKEIFDTAVIGGLLKATREDTLIDRHLPDVMKGMNALGRLILCFYWHGDQFGDRYGKSDLPEIEDGLRNAFEAAGQVFLDLKSKKVISGPGDAGGPGDDLDHVASV